MLKKGDKVVVLMAVCMVILSVAALFLIKPRGNIVIIKKDNEIVFEGSLDHDKTVELKTNTVVIKDGSVFVESASCKNQICVNHKKIRKAGESIVCLPNRVTVEIK